jgi:hypothetical protein
VVCVKAVDVPMMVREVHNPGITSGSPPRTGPKGLPAG